MDVSTDSRRVQATDSDGELSPLEQEVLDEYAKLVGNLDNVRAEQLFTSTTYTDLITAFRHLSRTGSQTGCRDSRRVTRLRAKDDNCVYTAQSQCVQHCSTAGDLW